MKGEYPFALFASLLSLYGGLGHGGLGDAGELGLILDDYLGLVGGVEKVFVVLEIEVGELFVKLGESGFVGIGEQGTATHEILIAQLDGAYLIRLQSERVASVIEGLDTLEEGGVHGDFVRDSRDHGEELLGDLFHLGSVIGLGENAIHSHHSVESGTRFLEGKDGVVEGGSFGVVDDFVDIGALFGDTGFHGGKIVGIGDFLERRNFKLGCVG